MTIYQRTLFLLSLFSLSLFSAHAQIASVNRALIDDIETITVFFETPETFKSSELQDQFKITHQYGDDKGSPLESGRWHLSADGYQLSYYPIDVGAYTVIANQYRKDDSSYDLYIGRSSQAVKIIGRGPVQPLTQQSLPIESIGAEKIDIEFFDIPNPAKLFERFYIGSDIDRWELDDLTHDLKPAGIFRYNLPKGTAVDRKTEHRIPVDPNIKPGAYIVTVSPAGQIYKELDTRIIFISDIGLHARRYDNQTLIMANYFSTTYPVTNAKLEVWNYRDNRLNITEESCSFKEGLCLINRALNNDDIAVVRKGEDISLLPMREMALDLNDFPIVGETYHSQVAHLYSNRQLYRPGETITLNALLRNDDGIRLPKQSIELRIITPDGKIDQTHTLTDVDNGFYQTDIHIDNDAKTGLWRAEVRTDPNLKRPNGELTLYIEEFMPERMELVLKTDETQLSFDQSLNIDIESRYLFGAPASHNQTNTQVSLDINKTPFIDHNDWYVGSPIYADSINYQPFEKSAALDSDGHTTQPVDLPFSGEIQQPPHIISTFVNVNVLDGDMAGISRRVKADFWPQAIVPVVRPLFKMSDLGWGSRANFEIFATNQKGERVPRDLRLTLKYKSDWCTWVYSASNGWDCHRNSDYEIHEMKSFDASTDIHRYDLDPNLWGEYALIITDIESGFETIYKFEANWDSSNDGQLPAAKPLALNMKPNKLNYKEGETINLEIDAPFDGFLTLLVEGDQPLYNDAFEVKRGVNQINLPLYADWKRHDLYLSGILLAKNSKEEVRRALGILPIALDRSDRRLLATLTVDSLTKPEEPLQVTINVDNPKPNEQLYATISVTDQGILNMTPTEPTNIFDAFFKQRRYNIDIIDYYNRLFKESTLALLTPQFGGDGEVDQGDSGPNLTEMKTVSLMSQLIPLDADGKGSTQFLLPDFNGEAKVVAKVFSESRANEAEQQIVIRAPIIADLVTPNFIRVHDETYVSLSLHNMAGRAESVNVVLQSDEISVDYHETFRLADQESRNVLIPMTLDFFTNEAYLNLIIDAPSFSTERSYRMGTVPYSSSKIVQTERERISSGDQWQKNNEIYASFDRYYDEMLLVSRHPIIDINNYTDDLFSYPYGCTEQTTSRAFPWLFRSHPILDQEKEFYYRSQMSELNDGEKVDQAAFSTWQKEMMRDAITRIIRRQNSDGGFSLWSSDHTNRAITAYATDFLYQAAQQYPDLVPAKALEKATARLKRYLTDMNQRLKKGGNDRYNYINDVAYGAWILAREGKIFSADLSNISLNSSKMSPLSRAYIATANFVVGNGNQGIRLINEVNFEEWNSNYGYFYTDVAEVALAIDLLNQLKAKQLYMDPDNRVEALLHQLNQRIQHKNYFSTQERYALVRIGVELPDDNRAISLRINEKEESVQPNRLINARGVDSIKGLDSENLYIQYQIEGYPEEKITSKSFDIAIDRHIENLYHSQVNVGDRFLVTLTIKPQRNVSNALIVDQIPGGFRLINPNLLDEEIDQYYGSFRNDLKRSGNLHHEEFRFNSYVASLDMFGDREYLFAYVIEAQTPGISDLPSTLVEAMYMPSLRAVQSYDGKITIKRLDKPTEQ